MITLYNTSEALKKDLIGKNFAYVSKYGGEVHGKVKSISIIRSGSIKTNRYRPEIYIISDFGVLYNMNEIYFY